VIVVPRASASFPASPPPLELLLLELLLLELLELLELAEASGVGVAPPAVSSSPPHATYEEARIESATRPRAGRREVIGEHVR